MHSFTSSSRSIVAWAIGAVCAYALAIETGQPRIETFPDAQTANLVKAQRYRLGQAQFNTVITGSSLSQRMPDSWLPEGTVNLAFSGESALTGLAIVAQNPIAPKRVLVETNLLARDVEAPFVEAIGSDGLLGLAKYIRAFRMEYRPINFVLSWFIGQPRTPTRSGTAVADCANRLSAIRHDSVSQKRLKRMLEVRLQQGPKETNLSSQMNNLRVLIEKIEARGTKVDLFEMPVDTRLAASDSYRALRRAITQALPGRTVRTFKPEDFTTTDGAHLATESAIRLSCLLMAPEIAP